MNAEIILLQEELKLIALIREIGFGEVTVRIRNNRPVIVEKGIQTIKLEQ